VSRSRVSIPEALRSLARAARAARAKGWTIGLRGSGHLEWRSPDGEVIITPSTPSDHRSYRNSRARLRRAGLRDEET
jgi:hypothetical protein